jgi:hypothetical protein
MNYLPIPDGAARQLMDSITVFTEFQRVFKQAKKYAGSMYWKSEKGYDYLIKTILENRKQERLGARSEASEKIMLEFTAHKSAIEERLKTIQSTLIESERLNKALKVGRAPQILIDILNVLHQSNLSKHFIVVGTHALYAYELAAGVRIVQSALATQDIDLLWDARKCVQFISDIEKLDSSLLNILKKVDRSFERKEGHNETAINAKGFEIDFLRREAIENDPHPFRFSNDEEDLWPVQAIRAAVLTSAPKFEHVVISSNGKMALMNTIEPSAFINFKLWMAAKAPYREEMKRRRDRVQAGIVQELIDQKLL